MTAPGVGVTTGRRVRPGRRGQVLTSRMWTTLGAAINAHTDAARAASQTNGGYPERVSGLPNESWTLVAFETREVYVDLVDDQGDKVDERGIAELVVFRQYLSDDGEELVFDDLELLRQGFYEEVPP